MPNINEISAIWDKFNEIELKLSQFYDMQHEKSQQGIQSNQNGLLDVAEETSNTQQGLFELSEIVSELVEGSNG